MDTRACEVLVVGGGIGGLAAALALSQQGAQVQLVEQAAALTEVGAGLQLGPNVTRILHGWGLAQALRAVASFPQAVLARDAGSGRVLGRLPLGERAQRLYGAPYVSIHRADLQHLLWQAVQARGVPLQLNWRLHRLQGMDAALEAQPQPDQPSQQQGPVFRAQMVVGADGLHSRSRQALGLHDALRFSGHVVYRGVLPAQQVPPEVDMSGVTVWMGPRLHVVHYPVQAGRSLNVAVIVQGRLPPQASDWHQEADRAQLLQVLQGHGPLCASLLAALHTAGHWRVWPLNDRLPLQAAAQMGAHRLALLGDAAHPMRPFLAQGAGMAIEDAHTLAQCWASQPDVPQAVQRYATLRWARNARVQTRAIRNGQIFHAQGLLRWGRNLGMAWGGARLMDVPWLYRGEAQHLA